MMETMKVDFSVLAFSLNIKNFLAALAYKCLFSIIHFSQMSVLSLLRNIRIRQWKNFQERTTCRGQRMILAQENADFTWIDKVEQLSIRYICYGWVLFYFQNIRHWICTKLKVSVDWGWAFILHLLKLQMRSLCTLRWKNQDWAGIESARVKTLVCCSQWFCSVVRVLALELKGFGFNSC